MNCNEIRELFSAYLDNELDAQTKKIAEGHLVNCLGCSGELQDLNRTILTLKKIPVIEPPKDFLESLHARLERPSVLTSILRRIFIPFYIKVPLEVLTVVATIIIVVFLTKENQMLKLARDREEAPLKIDVAATVAFSDKVIESGLPIIQLPQRIPPEILYQQRIFAQGSGMQEYSKSYQGGGLLKYEALNGVMFNGFGSTIKTGAGIQHLLGLRGNSFKSISDGQRCDLISIPETEIILKSKDLEADILKLEVILKETGAFNLKKEREQGKIWFRFSLFSFQWDSLLSKLKDWQILDQSFKEKPSKEKPSLSQPILIKLILTTQETPIP